MQLKNNKLENLEKRTTIRHWESSYDSILYSELKWGKKYFADSFKEITIGKKILELGSGSGALTIYLSEKCTKIIGIDSSENLIEFSKKNTPDELKNKISFFKEDILKVNLDEKFDIICGTAIIHEIDHKDYNELISFLKSHLNENGFCIFQENSYFNFLFRFFRKKVIGKGIFRKLGSESETPFDIIRYNILSENFKYTERVCDTFVLFDRFYFQFVNYWLKKYLPKVANMLGKLATKIDKGILILFKDSKFTRYWSYINTIYLSDYEPYQKKILNTKPN